MPNDKALKDNVEEELHWEPSVHSEQIGVSVKNGVVELDGHVASYYEKWAAERAALRVANVKAIASDIKVELPHDATRTDEDIARSALDHLSWNLLIPTTVKVKVTDGWVTLLGTVDWQYQSEEAARVVRPLRGIKGVTNDIDVEPKVSAVDIKGKIEAALKRNALLDAGDISVETSGGTVTLRGDVESWAERDEAEEAAWAGTRGLHSRKPHHRSLRGNLTTKHRGLAPSAQSFSALPPFGPCPEPRARNSMLAS